MTKVTNGREEWVRAQSTKYPYVKERVKLQNFAFTLNSSNKIWYKCEGTYTIVMPSVLSRAERKGKKAQIILRKRSKNSYWSYCFSKRMLHVFKLFFLLQSDFRLFFAFGKISKIVIKQPEMSISKYTMRTCRSAIELDKILHFKSVQSNLN